MADEIRQQLGFDASNTFAVLAQLNDAFAKFSQSLTDAAARMDAFNQAGAKVDDGVKKTSAAMREAARLFEQTRTPQEKYAATIEKLNGLLQQGAINQDTHSRAMKQAGEALSGAQKTAELAREGARIFEQTRTPQEKYASTTERLNTLLQQGAINQDTHTRALKTAQEALDATGKKVDGLTISWHTLARVVVTQLIVRAMSMVRDAFKDAYASALEFSKAVGEIRTIDPSRSFGEIAANIRGLSDAFNQPLSRVAEAQYQVISDQFVTAADRANILTAANQLAKVGNDDLVASAQLLTGALNAYGESSDMAGVRAAQFFESVNLGRFRMSELGTALGRVQSIGHELGLSMEELQASLITVTIGGVKSNEAATQLRGAMTALLKPSEGMKKAFHEIGVDSGEAAIATWGFQGTLQQLMEYTGGSATRMAELFQNVRGLAGVLRIAGEGAKAYNEGIDKLHISQENLNKIFKEFTETDAEKLTKELNKVKNFWSAEFGGTLVGDLQKVVSLIGGEGIVSALRAATSQTILLTAEAVTLGGAMAVAAGYAKLMKGQTADTVTGLRAAGILLAGLPIAQAAGQMIGERVAASYNAPYEAERDQLAKTIELRKQGTSAAIRLGEERNKEAVRGLRQYLVDANKIYLEDVENVKTALKVEEEVNKTAFNRIMQSRQRMTHELFSISEAAAKKAAEDIPRAIKDIEQKISDRRFGEEIAGKGLTYQFSAIQDRFERTARLAAELQGGAKSADQEREAAAAWNRAEALRQQAQEIAKQTGDAHELREVDWMIESLDRRRLDALREQAKTQEQLSKEAEDRANQAEAHNLELEQMRQTIEEKLKITTKSAEGAVQFKGREELKRDLDNAAKLIEEFVGKTREYNKEDFIKVFSGDTRAFDSIRREAERALASADLKRIEVAPQVMDDLYSQLQNRLAQMKITAPVLVEIERVTGMEIVKDGLMAVLDAYEKRLNEATARGILGPALAASLMDVNKQFDAMLQKTWQTIPATASKKDLMGADTLLRELSELRRSGDITEEQIGSLLTRLQGIDFTKVFSYAFGLAARLRQGSSPSS